MCSAPKLDDVLEEEEEEFQESAVDYSSVSMPARIKAEIAGEEEDVEFVEDRDG